MARRARARCQSPPRRATLVAHVGWSSAVGHNAHTLARQMAETDPTTPRPTGAPHHPRLLPRQVLRLPDQAVQRPAQPRALRGGALHALVRVGAGTATVQGVAGLSRRMDLRSLRQAALRASLQELQREALGPTR